MSRADYVPPGDEAPACFVERTRGELYRVVGMARVPTRPVPYPTALRAYRLLRGGRTGLPLTPYVYDVGADLWVPPPPEPVYPDAIIGQPAPPANSR